MGKVVTMWGSTSDVRLLKRMSSLHPSFKRLELCESVEIAEGPTLVATSVESGVNQTVSFPEVVGKQVLDVTVLSRLRSVFSLPLGALLPNTNHFSHLRRGTRGIAICRPPHVIVSAARNFTVFSDKYVVVPPRQIGIVSTTDDVDFRKSLSLYLSSDFAFYHQFFTSTKLGVKRDRATLNALRAIPVPISAFHATNSVRGSISIRGC